MFVLTKPAVLLDCKSHCANEDMFLAVTFVWTKYAANALCLASTTSNRSVRRIRTFPGFAGWMYFIAQIFYLLSMFRFLMHHVLRKGIFYTVKLSFLPERLVVRGMGEGTYTNPNSDKGCAATEERGGKNLKVAYSHPQRSTHFSSPVQV